MKLSQVLAQLSKFDISVLEDKVETDGSRTIVVGSRLPSIPFGPNRMAYCTLNLSADQDEVSLEEREAIRRHLWHLTTDIFGDDAAETAEIAAELASQGLDPSEECGDSVFHTIRRADRNRR